MTQQQFTPLSEFDTECIRRFLLKMEAFKWTKASKRLECALICLLESQCPEDIKLYE